MPGFISTIKAKLPSMSIKSPAATPSAEIAEPILQLEPGPELSILPPGEPTPAPADPEPAPTGTDSSIHVPGQLPLASTSSVGLADAPAAAPVQEPEPVTEASAPAPVIPLAEPEPKIETVVVGPITGGEPGLSDPVPGVTSTSLEETSEAPAATPAEVSTPAAETPAPAEPAPVTSAPAEPVVETAAPAEAAAPIEPTETPATAETPAPAEPIEAAASTDPVPSPRPEVPSTLSFPQTQPEGEAKENVTPRGMGRTIRQSIRRLGRSNDKVPSRKSMDASARKSIDVKAGPDGTPRKSADVPAVAEEPEEAEGVERKKVPLGDKLKGVFEEVKGRVKKNPEAVAYGKALRTGDLNV